jgi:branched-chain amino acid transport system ATP-binding protein
MSIRLIFAASQHPKIVEEIFLIMQGLIKEGLAIVLVEQNIRRAIELSTRFYAIERGQVLLQGDAANATQRQELFSRIAV